MTQIPYAHQNISEEDIHAVEDILRSEWLTQGPVVGKFEEVIADYCGAQYAVAVSSGTAALHITSLAAGFSYGDEVITSPITFVATPNSIIYSGATPIFADIDPKTYCIDPQEIKRHLTAKSKGLIPVHFAGQPCDMESIAAIARDKNLVVIEDAAHAIGATYEIDGHNYKIGSCSHSDMTIFSFHPVKHITTGEGGLITTNDEAIYHKLISLRTHGITKDPSRLTRNDGPWYYEQQDLGFNYRITDLQCALGLSQLKRLDEFIERRCQIADLYSNAFSECEELKLPWQGNGVCSSWHLYVLCLESLNRKSFFTDLQKRGVGVNVHYIPVHLQPYYKEMYGYKTGNFPQAENYYNRAITLPLYPAMTDDDVIFVIDTVLALTKECLA